MNSGALELLNPSRRMLVVELKDRGEATADELAAATYLSSAAVRMHLSALEQLSLLTHTRRRQGPGRPLNVYRLTDLGEQLFPQGYSFLLTVVLAAIRQSPEHAEEFWSALEAAQAAALGRMVVSNDPTERVHELFDSSEASAFYPRVEPDGPGCWRVHMRHCPIIEAARRDPKVCETETRIVQRVLGDGVTVISQGTRPEGKPICGMLIRTIPGLA